MNLETQRAIAILGTINAIPKGRLSTYGLVAQQAGYAGNARYVGQLLKNLPQDSSIPWFRVINSQGKISFPAGSPDFERQASALTKEGHPLPLGKAHLNNHLWPQPSKVHSR